MRGDLMRATVLSMRLIPRVDDGLKERLKLDNSVHAIGLLTCDSDDVGYAAIDEATKKAMVSVCYAQSMYGGAANANTALVGEFLGILAGPTSAEVESGLCAAQYFIENEASFVSANDDDSVVYFAHLISRTGSYLSESCSIPKGSPLAYLIAPPLESLYALDQALKAANVRVAAFYGPPSPTNFGGGLLTGSQSDCQSACEAFEQAVLQVARQPLISFPADTRQEPQFHQRGQHNKLLLQSHEIKPENVTHFTGSTLVSKNHPRIVFRGKLDTLQSETLLVMCEAAQWLKLALEDVLRLLRRILAAEFKGEPLGEWKLDGMDAEQVHWASHHPEQFGYPNHILPDAKNHVISLKINRLRTLAREAEICAVAAFEDKGTLIREDLVKSLNRLSSFLYVLQLRTNAIKEG